MWDMLKIRNKSTWKMLQKVEKTLKIFLWAIRWLCIVQRQTITVHFEIDRLCTFNSSFSHCSTFFAAFQMLTVVFFSSLTTLTFVLSQARCYGVLPDEWSFSRTIALLPRFELARTIFSLLSSVLVSRSSVKHQKKAELAVQFSSSVF